MHKRLSFTEAEEWKLPEDEQEPCLSPVYVVSFGCFHERGFASPSHEFFRRQLHHYKMELQHLNPNGI